LDSSLAFIGKRSFCLVQVRTRLPAWAQRHTIRGPYRVDATSITVEHNGRVDPAIAVAPKDEYVLAWASRVRAAQIHRIVSPHPEL
jgi:hypothetical protein